MKKIFTLLCVAFLATSLLANVVTGTCGDNLQWSYDTDTKALTITGSGDMWDYNYWGYDYLWAQVGGEITSVSLPDGLTRIGNYAFYYCSSITSITIPNSVTSIGGNAFTSCSSLTSITIPNSVTSIGVDAFYNTGIYNTESNWDKGVLYIDNCLIRAKGDISGAYAVKEDTRLIAAGAFMGSSLTSVTIPNNVTNMGGGIFAGCSYLQSVVLPENITAISNVYMDGAVRSTGFFEYCRSLTAVTIPSAVTLIEDYAFAYCSSLTSITLNSPTPPHVEMSNYEASTFEDVDNSIPIYVPCGCVGSYKRSEWSYFSNIQEPLAEYSINLTINDSNMGTVQVDKNNVCGNQISATANYGYHFVQWSDGSTDNPRSLVLTQDTVLTAEFTINNYTISTLCNDTERGTTSGDVTTTYLDYVTISATANYGYHFSHWDDYNYDNPRKVQVTEDKTYTAYFDKNTYYITKNYDSNQGYVDGYSSGEYLDNITLTAEANYGYHFVKWSDGNTDNPRHFILTQDTTFSAEFAQTFSGQCGDNLYWSYQNNSLIISGFGEMYDGRPWGLFTNEIQTVVLPNGITHIGNDAFSDCTGLNEITIPYTVTSIGDYAFAGCRKLVHVNCYAINPPLAESTSFANYNVYLNVPCDNLQDYQLDMVFGSFKYIQCMEADSENVPTDDVVVTPGTNDVTITWPTAENADTYTIVIQKGSEVFCTLTFNAEGQLLNIAFAPSRDGNNRPAQYAEQAGNGYRFTVTGLEAGTDYTYDITVKDASNQTINSHIGEFSTQSTTAVDNISTNNANIQKIIRNGQLLILRDGKTYNTMGAEIR